MFIYVLGSWVSDGQDTCASDDIQVLTDDTPPITAR